MRIYNKVALHATCVLTLASLLLASCGKGAQRPGNDGADTIEMRYAEHITMVEHDGYTVVTLDNPWKPGAVLHTYVLVGRADSARVRQLPQGTVLYTPVTRCVAFTAPHCQLLEWLGAQDAIKGVCDLKYVHAKSVQDNHRKGLTADCGDGMSPKIERIVEANAQALLLSPFENTGFGRVGQIGVPIVECADYMETSALGRAEWMRFYGRLFGRGQAADSLFSVVESQYTRLKEQARKSTMHRSIIAERKTGSVWYCPGGHSSMGRLFADAAAKYAFAHDEHSGSLPLSPETVVEQASGADVWVFIHSGGQAVSSAILLSEYRGYAQLKAFRTGEVYGCDSEQTPYFDEVSFRPDYLLADFVRLLHPDVADGKLLRYYKKISR